MVKKFSSFVVLIGIGLVLMTAGWQNYKIMKGNPKFRIMPMKDLVTAPLESPIWVEIKGIPKAGSLVTKKKSRYLLFIDDESKWAISVKLSKKSSLNQQTKKIKVVGMVSPLELSISIPTYKSLPDIKIANLVLEENMSPPGKWSSYGLIILGFLFVMVPYKGKVKKS